MKNRLPILLSLLYILIFNVKSQEINYVNSSVLASGNFFKVRIQETGIYKLTYEELRAKGIDPTNVRMFGYGGAVLDEDFSKTYWDDLPEIAIYDSGNYILFFGQGINKIWYENNSFQHKINSYSQYGYYFITSSDVGEKKRITTQPEITATTYNDIYHFTDYQVHEKEVHNMIKSGKEFYGEKFTTQSNSTSISLNFPNIDLSTPIKTKVSVGTKSSVSSTFTIDFNGISNNIGVSANAGEYLARTANSTFNFNPVSSNLNFTINYNSNSTLSEGFLNYLAVTAKRQLIMEGNCMLFYNIENIDENAYNKYHLSTSNTDLQIWDITDVVNVNQLAINKSANQINFLDSSSEVKRYIAFYPNSSNGFLSVQSIDGVQNQNIHAEQPIDMMIITPALFLEQAYRLAQAHYDHDGLKVGVFTMEQLYNEFSSGTPDATAYRRAAQMFYDKPDNQEDKLKYLLLFGKGSYDNRGIISGSGYNHVLTYQADNSIHAVESYLTDDYFGMLTNTKGINMAADTMDIGIGRFPVATVQQAENVVTKTINYMKNDNKGGWKNQICFVGDDGGDKQIKQGHATQANKMADYVIENYPAYQVNKLLLDAYQQVITSNGEEYPDVKSRLHNMIHSGLFLVNYTGHANPSKWANEEILTSEEIKNFTNINLPIFTTGSCEFSLFDQQTFSGGEELLLNPNGGGIGVYAAARTVYAPSNDKLFDKFFEVFFLQKNEEYLRIGDITRRTKNNYGGSNISKLNYVYFGDPALRLNYPHPYKVEVTSINGKSVTETDTLKALSIANVKGNITDKTGEIDENFNGYMKIIVFDKEEDITTLDNHKEDIAFTFKDRPNTIYNGKTKVENGRFDFTFMLPKDIKYNYGTGRFNFYAWDDENDKEGQGYFEEFMVGGSSDDFIYEEEGPEATIYLNYPDFISGTRVNDTILFVANLHDINGINTSGSTGHDIVLCIAQNGREIYRYILNDYYEADEGSYQSGKINFLMIGIDEGKYSLSFKVWDLLNNSTTRNLDFEVVKGLRPTVYSVMNYPNPATTHTYFEVKQTREYQKVELTLDIFDLSGRKVWSFTEKETGSIYWDLKGANGRKMDAGIYIYRASIQSGGKILSSESNKIIISKQ